MRAIDRFLKKDKPFWACVRSLSQEIGYSKKGQIVVPTLSQMCKAFVKLELDPHALRINDIATPLASDLMDYFKERARLLTEYVEPRLMEAERAKKVFEEHRSRLHIRCPLPMNKQKGEKKAPAYLTGLANVIIEAETGNCPVDYDPRRLTTFTKKQNSTSYSGKTRRRRTSVNG